MKERMVHRWFLVSVWLKGLDAIIELIGGLILLVPVQSLERLAQVATAAELTEDPHDPIANLLRDWAASLTVSSTRFFSAYLLIHGLVKVVLVYGLLRNKLWAYPTSLIVLCAFIVYQLYRLSHVFTLGLAALTVFDAIVIALVWHEFRAATHRPATSESP